MSAIKTTPKLTLSDEAKEFAASKHLDAALSAALHLVPEFFVGASEIEIDLQSGPESEQADPSLVMFITTVFERADFQNAMLDYLQRLRTDNNPLFLHLALLNR